MSKPTDICIKSAISSTECIEYRSPIKFGGRVVTDATLLHVTVEVETQRGRCATGFGSMPMGNVWAWPSPQVSSEITLKAMVAFAEQSVGRASGSGGSGHPLDLTTELSRDHASIAKDVEKQFELSEPMPRLAQLVSASPLEAAIHDAYGKVLGQSSYNVLGSDFVSRDLSHWLGDDFAGEYLDQYTLRQPKPSMPLYHLVGCRSE